MRRVIFTSALLTALLAPAVSVNATEADDAQIRQARAAINKAFAKHDLAAMQPYITERITWTGPAWRIVGREMFEKNHKQYWEGRSDATWDYTPTKITAFNAWHWLSEEGTWSQKWMAADGPTELRGTYLGFWQETDGKWKLDAHLFITTSCTPVERAFCRRDTRPPATR